MKKQQKTNRKKYFFTCCAIVSGKLVGDTFFLSSREEAYQAYKDKYGVTADFFDGPFYRKIEKNKREIKKSNVRLSNKLIKGKYKDFNIKAVMLIEPKDYVYIIYTDGNNNEDKIVHISEIKE